MTNSEDCCSLSRNRKRSLSPLFSTSTSFSVNPREEGPDQFFQPSACFCEAVRRHANNTLRSRSWWFQSTSSRRPWTRTENIISMVHKEFVSRQTSPLTLARADPSNPEVDDSQLARQTHEFAQPHARDRRESD